MACLEHECAQCRHVWFTNVAWQPCPQCSSEDFFVIYDEDDLAGNGSDEEEGEDEHE